MDWTQIVIILIQLVIAPLIIWGVKEGVGYLKTKAKNEKLAGYIDRAEDAILTAVEETQQIFVDAIKGTSGWDQAAMEQAFQQSLTRSKQIMGEAVYAGLTEAVDDVNAWITAKINQSVRITKSQVLQEVMVDEIKTD